MPLLASTVAGRIGEIDEDIDTQLLHCINTSLWYALQIHESTDIDNKAMLLVNVRYLYQEDFLCALSLSTNTTGTEMFQSLDGYISGQLKWSYCVGMRTDRDAAMT